MKTKSSSKVSSNFRNFQLFLFDFTRNNTLIIFIKNSPTLNAKKNNRKIFIISTQNSLDENSRWNSSSNHARDGKLKIGEKAKSWKFMGHESSRSSSEICFSSTINHQKVRSCVHVLKALETWTFVLIACVSGCKTAEAAAAAQRHTPKLAVGIVWRNKHIAIYIFRTLETFPFYPFYLLPTLIMTLPDSSSCVGCTTTRSHSPLIFTKNKFSKLSY